MAQELNQPLVSVIMPAHNAAAYILEAIRSLQAQTHTHWELIVVDDGGTDATATIVGSVQDPRIALIQQPHRGVSAARNAALQRARGAFVCSLDADDVMPPRGISARLEVLQHDPSISFADGAVSVMDRELHIETRHYTPLFRGEPFERLLRFDTSCFFGNTWMIRADAIGNARFDEALSHSEDLLFYLAISPGKRYAFTEETVLLYRVTGTSSMSRLENLERSYHRVLRWMKEHPELVSTEQRSKASYIVRRMMSLSYLKGGRPWPALRSWFIR